MMYRTCRLPWRNSFPRSGSCCVSNNPRGFLYLSAGYCCHWQDWPTCKVSSSKNKKKKKKKRSREPDYLEPEDRELQPLEHDWELQPLEQDPI